MCLDRSKMTGIDKVNRIKWLGTNCTFKSCEWWMSAIFVLIMKLISPHNFLPWQYSLFPQVTKSASQICSWTVIIFSTHCRIIGADGGLFWTKQFSWERKPNSNVSSGSSHVNLDHLCPCSQYTFTAELHIYWKVKKTQKNKQEMANCSIIQFRRFCQVCKLSLISQESDAFISKYH